MRSQRSRSTRLVSLVLGTCCALASCSVAPVQAEIDFEREIAPIFAAHCLDCHNADTREMGLRLDHPSALRGGDSGEPLVIAGDPDASHLIQVLTDPDSDIQMPPDGESPDPAEIELLRRWIREGAVWPGGDESGETEPLPWSFQRLKASAVPTEGSVEDRGVIDRWLTTAQRQRGVNAVRQEHPREWLIRASLVVTGLRPEAWDLAAFEADSRPDAVERAIDRLLASPAMGERWGRHWLDVARFAETSGFETNVPRADAFPYRDWVIRAFDEDRSVASFVRDQIAGDSTGADEATGFLVGGAWDQVKSSDPVLTNMQRQDELADMINTTGTAFLGLTLGCARCHNHKFDPISQKDYYALQAIFVGVQHGSRPFEVAVDPQERQRIQHYREQVARLEARLESHERIETPVVSPQSQWIDEDLTAPEISATRALGWTEHLKASRGVGTLVDSSQRGGSRDPGNASRHPNLGGATYRWWDTESGRPIVRYHLGATGAIRLWASWGCGWETHCQDAIYAFDADGDWQTADDRVNLATVDQRHFADGSVAPQGMPLHSGLLDLGVVQATESSTLFVVSGNTGTAITTDVVIVEPVLENVTLVPSPALRSPIVSTQNELRFPPVMANRVRMVIEAAGGSEPCLDEFEVWTAGSPSINVAAASRGAIATSAGDLQGYAIHRLEHVNDGQYGNDHSWISATADRGMIEIEWPETVSIDRIVWGRDRSGGFKDRTATRWSIQVSTQEGSWQTIAEHRHHVATSVPGPWRVDRHRGMGSAEAVEINDLYAELDQYLEQLDAVATEQATVYAGTFTTPPTVYRLYRGDAMQPREEVSPSVPDSLVPSVGALSGNWDIEASRRRALADWLASPNQSLVWRVMANRLWHWTFGRGIVSTPSDLGVNGAPCDHPELLDHLAISLRDADSFKWVLRQLLVSQAFRRSASFDSQSVRLDADAITLWRFPSRRLEAEAIRDTLFQSVGNLDRRRFGPGYSVFEPNDNYVRNYIPRTQFTPETWRRMVYMTKVRMEQDPIFGLFDVPDGGQVCPKRTVSTSPLQALNLLNAPFVVDQASRLVEELEREFADDLEGAIREAFVRVLQRTCDDTELAAARQLVAQHGLAPLCRALWNANEFVTVP